MNKSTFVLRRSAYQKKRNLHKCQLKLAGCIIGLLVLITLALSGCAGQSLEELETEALITGDWTRVEKREAKLNERKREAEMARKLCGDKILVCKMHMGKCHSYSCVNSVKEILVFQ